MKHSLVKKAIYVGLYASFAIMPLAAQAEEPINVGVLLSLSGPAAAFGIPERDTIKVLTEKFNRDAGPSGRKIKLIYYDDMTNPTEAARGATQLIDRSHVVAILGPTTGSGALAMAPIAAANSVPVLAPVGTISFISKEHKFYPWAFRTSIRDDLAVDEALKRTIFDTGKKNIAIMYQEDAYGKSTNDFIVKVLKKHGVNVVADVSAPMNSADLTPVATKIRNANPEAVFVQASAPALGAAFARAASQVGITAPLIGSLALNQRAFLENAGDAANSMIMVSLGNFDNPSQKEEKLADLLGKDGKKLNGFGELIAATAFQGLASAIKNTSGSITGSKLRDSLASLCNLKETYLNGTVCFSDHDGIRADSLSTLEVQGGSLKTVR